MVARASAGSVACRAEAPLRSVQRVPAGPRRVMDGRKDRIDSETISIMTRSARTARLPEASGGNGRLRSVRRVLCRLWLSGLLGVLLACLCTGCVQRGTENGGTGGQSSGSTKTESAPPKPLLEGWDAPAVVLLFTGETHGYLEPCGCALNQAGGFARRHDLFQKLRARGWPLIAADLGGLIRRSRQQSRVKFQIMLEGLAQMGYSALQLGPEELHLGAAELLSNQANLLAAHAGAADGAVSDSIDRPATGPVRGSQRPAEPSGDSGGAADGATDTDAPPAHNQGAETGVAREPLRFLGANIVFFQTPDLAEGPRPWVLVERSGVKVALVGVFGQSLVEATFPGGTGDEITIRPPEEVLPDVLAEVATRKPDLRVLLVHANLPETRRLIERFPQFDVVVSTGGVEDPLADNPVQVGRTLLCTVGHKGKYVGAVGYFPGQSQRLRFELIELDQQRFSESPQMHQLMARYQQLLKELDLARTEPAIAHPSGGTFVGAEACGRCHTRAYQKWKTSRHAHAYESLKVGRKGQEKQWIPRIYDPECLCCHVTGWDPQQVLRYESGFVSIEDTPHLADQQCENCHGPGGGPGRHVELEARWLVNPSAVSRDELIAGRRQMKRTIEQAEKSLCVQCHDLDNSPRFQFAKYWEEVKHPWRD